ncbi:MAG: hypothetical protein N3E49_09450, partial [Bacteroidia bacterium]|nr:hypothetical protein [Bacteroidia bacterium]
LGLSARNVAAPVVNPAIGLLVFNTATAGAGTNRVWPGFYWWNGNEWVRLLVYPNEAWQIEGNFGTNPAIHFLGTIDNQPLRIRVNNQQTLQFNTNFSIQRDAGGNVRGLKAVDLQIERADPTEVASGDFSTLLGGRWNSVTARLGVVCGGSANTVEGENSGICSGGINRVSGIVSFIGGGLLNLVSGGTGCFIGGGVQNQVEGWSTTSCGGYQNSADGGCSCIIAGGHGNVIMGGTNEHAFIGGGGGNVILPNSDNSAILSGRENRLTGYGSIILGGYKNEVVGNFSIVSGICNLVEASNVLVFGSNVDPSTNESHRVYFFGDNSDVPNPEIDEPPVRYSGFLVVNRRDGDHPIHVGTNGTNGNGAYLSAGGTWTNASSRDKKDRFNPLSAQEVLQKIQQLPIQGWYYKGTQEYHIGPFAEDFYAAFGTGIQDMPEYARTSLAASDVAGVALVGIQALAQENAQLRDRLQALEAENAKLRTLLTDIETRLKQMEIHLSPLSSR